MKFEIGLKALTEALSVVSRAAAGKSPLRPILANLLFAVESQDIQIVATDLEILLSSRLQASIEAGGHFTIPAKLLLEVMSNIPAGTGKEKAVFELIDQQSNSILISCGRNKFNLQAQGIGDYPPVPVLSNEEFPRFDVSSKALKAGIHQAQIAIGGDDTNPMQRCLCMTFSDGNQLILISTDTRRLAMTKVSNITYPKEFERIFLVPARAVPEILKLLDEVEFINLGFFKQQLVFTTADYQLLTRLVEGKFPDYNKVIPKESNKKLTINKEIFGQALKSVIPIARHSSSMVRLDIGANELRVWSQSPEQGMSEVFIEAKFEGEPINIAFNAGFLQDFIGVVDGEQVSIDLTTPNYPGILKSADAASPFIYVAMPMTNFDQ